MRTRNPLQAVKTAIKSYLMRLCTSCPWSGALYYLLCSPAFRREEYGVFYGRIRYAQGLKKAQYTSYLLRRDIHRLEKGLLMRPFRDCFALDFIEDVMATYHKARQTPLSDLNETEIRWAHDVLTRYFEKTGTHPVIEAARQRFNALPPLDFQNYTPYTRDLSQPPPVTYEQLYALSLRRRSTRWYLQQPVARELIDQAITLASQSPSACNRQPFEFRIFDQPEWVQKVSEIPMGTVGFSQNFPVIVVIVGQLNAYFDERDRHLIYIDGSLAAMSFMYALETMGLSSCPINWPDMEDRERRMAETLNLLPDERVVMLISLGWPDPEGMVASSQKKSLTQLRRYNHE